MQSITKILELSFCCYSWDTWDLMCRAKEASTVILTIMSYRLFMNLYHYYNTSSTAFCLPGPRSKGVATGYSPTGLMEPKTGLARSGRRVFNHSDTHPTQQTVRFWVSKPTYAQVRRGFVWRIDSMDWTSTCMTRTRLGIFLIRHELSLPPYHVASCQHVTYGDVSSLVGLYFANVVKLRQRDFILVLPVEKCLGILELNQSAPASSTKQHWDGNWLLMYRAKLQDTQNGTAGLRNLTWWGSGQPLGPYGQVTTGMTPLCRLE